MKHTKPDAAFDDSALHQETHNTQFKAQKIKARMCMLAVFALYQISDKLQAFLRKIITVAMRFIE